MAALEPGELTQHVGASYIPSSLISKVCGMLLEKLKVKLRVPGLLFIDTPGHAAFMSMRKRGGSVADLAILVIDLVKGFQEQTDESLKILKRYRVPFLVAATKIDLIRGWFVTPNACFLESWKKQSDWVREELNQRIYKLVGQLAERGFEAERFDRVKDFKREIAIVPVSGISGEGIPELLTILAGLAQQFLKDKLKLSEVPRGSVLEVKEERGLGTTIDVILYDGKLRKGDFLVVGGRGGIVTKIRALLLPRALQELRVEKRFESVDEVVAACGVKVLASGLERAIPGASLTTVSSEAEAEAAKKRIQSEVEAVEFKRAFDGVVIKADTLGSLEAMLKLLEEESIPVKKAGVGVVTREDLVDAQSVKTKYERVIFVFNLRVDEEVRRKAKDFGVKIFDGDVIYRLVENYKSWVKEEREKEIREMLAQTKRIAELKVVPGAVFRQSKPAIFGVDVLRGVLRPGVLLKREDGKIIGKVKEIQSEGRTIKEARKGDRVAISLEEPIFGRHVFENDLLITVLSETDLERLRKAYSYLSQDERELVDDVS